MNFLCVGWRYHEKQARLNRFDTHFPIDINKKNGACNNFFFAVKRHEYFSSQFVKYEFCERFGCLFIKFYCPIVDGQRVFYPSQIHRFSLHQQHIYYALLKAIEQNQIKLKIRFGIRFLGWGGRNSRFIIPMDGLGDSLKEFSSLASFNNGILRCA